MLIYLSFFERTQCIWKACATGQNLRHRKKEEFFDIRTQHPGILGKVIHKVYAAIYTKIS